MSVRSLVTLYQKFILKMFDGFCQHCSLAETKSEKDIIILDMSNGEKTDYQVVGS